MEKPSVFIGCSSESLKVAEAVQRLLSNSCVAHIWSDRGVFLPGMSYLESLVLQLEQCEYAVLILEANDRLESRGTSQDAPRDNVLFELGLFMGRLGRTRSFIVEDASQPFKFPSDLDGIKTLKYSPRQDMDRALRPVCDEILSIIQSQINRAENQLGEDAIVRVLSNPVVSEYALMFDHITGETTFLCYNPPFKIEGEPGDPGWEKALCTHAARYERGVRTKYLFFNEASRSRAFMFFRELESRMKLDLLGSVIRLRHHPGETPPTTFFTGRKAGHDMSVFYPAIFQNSGRPRLVILVEGATELVRALRHKFDDEWDEAQESEAETD